MWSENLGDITRELSHAARFAAGPMCLNPSGRKHHRVEDRNDAAADRSITRIYPDEIKAKYASGTRKGAEHFVDVVSLWCRCAVEQFGLYVDD